MKFIFLLFIVSTFVIANTQFIHQVGEAQIISLVYEEEGIPQLKQYNLTPGKLQYLVFEKNFASYKEALTFTQEKMKNYSQVESLRSSDLVTTERTNHYLWEATEEWDLQWEEEYAQWVASFPDTFFSDHNIKTDCADLAYALRWIFARMHHLPVGATLAGSGVYFTHESVRSSWTHLETAENWYEDELFLTALNYVLVTTYTVTLRWETYPVELTVDALKPGTVYMPYPGHTTVIWKTGDLDGESYFLKRFASTVPRIVRDLNHYANPDSHLPTDPNRTPGYRRFPWPVNNGNGWEKTPITQMPMYSLDQFDENFLPQGMNLYNYLLNLFAPNFSPELIIETSVNEIYQNVLSRISVVEEGYAQCQLIDCSEGTAAWEDWSTPSRDSALRAAINDVKNFASQYHMQNQLNHLTSQLSFTVLGINISLSRLFDFDITTFSNDPRDSVASRWAILSDESAEELRQLFLTRETKVIEGQAFCQINNCDPGSTNYEMWSTENEDREIRDQIYRLSSYLAVINNTNFTFDIEGIEINLTMLRTIQNYLQYLFQSDPNLTIKERWGVWDYSDFKQTSNPYEDRMAKLIPAHVLPTLDIQFEYFHTESCCDALRSYGQAGNLKVQLRGDLQNASINLETTDFMLFQTDSSIVREGFKVLE